MLTDLGGPSYWIWLESNRFLLPWLGHVLLIFIYYSMNSQLLSNSLYSHELMPDAPPSFVYRSKSSSGSIPSPIRQQVEPAS